MRINLFGDEAVPETEMIRHIFNYRTKHGFLHFFLAEVLNCKGRYFDLAMSHCVKKIRALYFILLIVSSYITRT